MSSCNELELLPSLESGVRNRRMPEAIAISVNSQTALGGKWAYINRRGVISTGHRITVSVLVCIHRNVLER
jgi:hypothetical protein